MEITYKVALEVATHEAIIRQAYKDSVGTWTWSIGLTSATGHIVERYIGKPQSLDHCLRVYIWALNNYADAVRKMFKGYPLTEAQFAAALSFHWNTGAIESASWVPLFKAKKYAAAEKKFMEWDKPAEIIGRRKAEANLLFRGVWSQTGKITEYTKLTTKSTPVWKSAKKIDISKELEMAIKGDVPASDQVVTEKNVAVAPKAIDKPIEKTSGFWERATQILTGGGVVLAPLFGADWKWIVAMGAVVIVVGIVGLVFHKQIIDRVKAIKEQIND